EVELARRPAEELERRGLERVRPRLAGGRREVAIDGVDVGERELIRRAELERLGGRERQLRDAGVLERALDRRRDREVRPAVRRVAALAHARLADAGGIDDRRRELDDDRARDR